MSKRHAIDQAANEPRRIAICGTGHPAPEPEHWRYIDTVMLADGALVFHVFESIEGTQP